MKLARLGLVWVLLVALAAGLALADGDTPLAEPKVVVETYPQWREGDLAIFIMDFPQDGATYQRNSIRFRVAVWGATEDRPIVIILDGEEAARIEGEGMFTYEWSLRGSHHLLIRGPTRIFQQAAFNVKSPPPPPPMIQLAELEARLEKQRSAMLFLSVLATGCGVPSGVWVKKKTKITTVWALIPFGAVMLAGLRWLPDLYMLIPYALAAALTYALARDYADYISISMVNDGGIEADVVPLDDEGRAILAVGPRYWRDGFMKVKKLELINKKNIDVKFKGRAYRGPVVESPKDIKETPDKITVYCKPALARCLAEAKVVEKLQDRLANMEFRLIFYERAVRSLVAQAVTGMEKVMEDSLLDEVMKSSEVISRVDEAVKRFKQVLEKPEQIPEPQVAQEEEVEADE